MWLAAVAFDCGPATGAAANLAQTNTAPDGERVHRVREKPIIQMLLTGVNPWPAWRRLAAVTGYVLRRLTPDAETIAKLYAEGMSLEDLAIRWHCHPSTIRRLLISQNVQLRQTSNKRNQDAMVADIIEALEAGGNVLEVARRFKVRPAAVAQLLVSKGDAFSN